MKHHKMQEIEFNQLLFCMSEEFKFIRWVPLNNEYFTLRREIYTLVKFYEHFNDDEGYASNYLTEIEEELHHFIKYPMIFYMLESKFETFFTNIVSI